MKPVQRLIPDVASMAGIKILIWVLALVIGLAGSCTVRTPQDGPVVSSSVDRAYAQRASDVQVEGQGVVTRVLSDDKQGSRHQRFIVRLPSGNTVLIQHNIDLAPRVAGLKVGDTVGFFGEYVWNEQGGLIHWTHHDPQGRHIGGWVEHGGRKFE